MSEHKVPSVQGYTSVFDLYPTLKLTCKANQTIHKGRCFSVFFYQHFIMNTLKYKDKLKIIQWIPIYLDYVIVKILLYLFDYPPLTA